MSENYPSGSPGPSTDRHNDPVIDPTANVLRDIASERRRYDDLFEIESKWRDKEAQWRDKESELRAQHTKDMRQAETDRIDAIRAVDVGAVQRAAEVQAQQAEALRQSQVETAEALRQQVATTAIAFEAKLDAKTDPLQKRIDDLSRAQYEAQGQKTQVVESRAGNGAVWAAIGGIVGLALLILAFYAALRTGTPVVPQIVTVTTP